MNGFKNWSVIPTRTWRIRRADEGDGWLKMPAIPIPVDQYTQSAPAPEVPAKEEEPVEAPKAEKAAVEEEAPQDEQAAV